MARCTVERRMRDLGLSASGVPRRCATVAGPGHERAADRLRRDFTAERPNAQHQPTNPSESTVEVSIEVGAVQRACVSTPLIKA